MIFAANEIDEVVGAEVTLLTEEDVDDLLPLARPLAADRLESAQIG
jgi:hypothetical protein